MAVKRTGQLSFVDALLAQGVGGSGRLDASERPVGQPRISAGAADP